MNIFDAAMAAVVDTTSSVFGYTATWVKDDDHTYAAPVKYIDKAGQAKLGEVKFGVDNWMIEIKDSDFPGLKDLINLQTKVPMSINVRGTIINFFGIVADPVSDGFCTSIKLRLKP